MYITYRLKKIMDVCAILHCKWIFIKSYVLYIKMGKWHFYTYTCTHSLYGHYLYQLYDGLSDNFIVNDKLIRSDLHYFPILGPEGIKHYNY